MNVEMLLDLIQKTPTAWHAVSNASALLRESGFLPLPEGGAECPGPGAWYTVRNGCALTAFRIPESMDKKSVSFRISAAHGDSPCFRLKPNGTLGGSVSRLNAERYGGGIWSTWMDAPLSLAGRVTLRTGQGLRTELLYVEKPAAVIPSLPIHLNREANGGVALDPTSDLVPVLGESGFDLLDLISRETGASAGEIAGYDLALVVAGRGFTFGKNGEFCTSPRLDDLECVYTCLDGFLSAEIPENTIPVFALFDNEETGSLTYAGARGTFLRDTLARILPEASLRRGAFARSFFVSADNAHGLHPNRPDRYDSENAPRLNGGPVVKYNAAQKYVTDGFSGAVFSEICRRAGIPVQVFANRSDLPGGSTLGNLSEGQVPVRGVDIGAAQWAMHSARETAGSRDVEYLSAAMKAFYSADFTLTEDGILWKD